MGHQAIIQGAKRGGCSFAAGGPSPIVRTLFATAADLLPSPALLQAESDVSALSHALEASATGMTAMVATSGAGLSACAESIAFAHLAELPIVILHIQHFGTEYGGFPFACDVDVTLARHVGIAGIPLPVLAVADAVSAYQLTHAAFALAHSLMTPVVLLTSNLLMTMEHTAGLLEPGPWLTKNYQHVTYAPDRSFDTAPKSGYVSFAAGMADRRVFLNLRPAEVEERLRKLQDKICDPTRLPECVRPDADPDAETLLLSYGQADRPSRQAVEIIRSARGRVSHLTVYSLWPVPQEALRRAMTPYVRRVLVPEMNIGLYADQLRKVLKNVKIDSLARFDGLPLDPQTIARQVTDWPCG